MAKSGAKIALVGIISVLIIAILLFLVLIIAFRKRLDNCIVSSYGDDMPCLQTYCDGKPYPPKD